VEPAARPLGCAEAAPLFRLSLTESVTTFGRGVRTFTDVSWKNLLDLCSHVLMCGCVGPSKNFLIETLPEEILEKAAWF